MTENCIDLDGVAIEYHSQGDGPGAPLVLLHEGLGSVGLWRGFPAALRAATGRRVITFSRFGHGASGPPPAPRTPRFFHEEALRVLPALLDTLGVERPFLVGHSDGASIALIHAAEHEVEGVALLAPHVFVEPKTVAAIKETRERYLAGPLRQALAHHHQDPDAAFWGWCDVWLDPDFATWALDVEIASLEAPTLLIQSAADPYGSLEQLDRIEAGSMAPIARLVVGGGHNPHLERAHLVTAAVASFAVESAL